MKDRTTSVGSQSRMIMETHMTSSFIAVLSTSLAFLMATGFVMYRMGFRKGLKNGETQYKRDIFVNGAKYVALGELGAYAEKLQDEGYAGDYPMQVFSAEEYLE